PLSSLTQLQQLYLGKNEITDLSPIASFLQLQSLYLNENQLTDIDPLSGLENLTTLSLDDNQIRDINPLSHVRSLEILYANGNQIEEIDPISHLPNLTQLYLKNNQIAEIPDSPLLSQLTYLQLGNNRLTDIEVLASLDRAIELDLSQNRITDISSLSSLENSIKLDLRNNPIPRKNCPVSPATICLFSDDAAELYRQGIEQTDRGEFLAALETFQTALQVYKNRGDRLRESDTLDRLGNLYDELGEYANALEYYQQSDNIRKEVGDRQGESETSTYLGITYIRLGQTQKAIDSLQQAWEIYRNLTTKDRSWLRSDSPEGTILSSLALAYGKLGETSPALRFAKQSLASYRRVNDRPGEAIALTRVGEAYLSAGNPDKARLYLTKALNLSQEGDDRPGIARSLHELGDLYTTLGDKSAALERYRQARELRQNIGDAAGEGETLNAMGELLLQTGKSAEAVEALTSAVDLWESLRPGLTDENKISIAETQAQTYQLLQEAFVDRGEVEAALEISERGRARAFAELLAQRLRWRGQTPPPETVQPPAIAQIQQIARDRQSTLVEYALVGEELYIWVVQPTGKIRFRRRSLAGKSVEELVTNNRWALGVRGRGAIDVVFRENNLLTTRDTLHQLYQLLVEPIADFLPENPDAPLIIVPQGELFLVPFAALEDKNGIAFLEKHTLRFSPAIGLLATVQSSRDPLRIGSEAALIVGNPTMPDDPATGVPLPTLLGAQQEAIAIAPLLNAQPLIGAEATKAAVKSQLGEVAIAHFATHGLLDDFGTGVPGALALTPTDDDSGFLTAAEIFTLPLKARLVVLSACDTGRGNITGDGVLGLSRSFLTAGVESVVVSLWSVPDEPTAVLMTEFYRQLQRNSDRAIALRQAMLATREQYPHPSNWAAFISMGDR
ncbi:MAG: CHAT domain-containing protein, partial [Cyanobacteria bacterium J055]